MLLARRRAENPAARAKRFIPFSLAAVKNHRLVALTYTEGGRRTAKINEVRNGVGQDMLLEGSGIHTHCARKM